jgi:hypothetical protein
MLKQAYDNVGSDCGDGYENDCHDPNLPIVHAHSPISWASHSAGFVATVSSGPRFTTRRGDPYQTPATRMRSRLILRSQRGTLFDLVTLFVIDVPLCRHAACLARTPDAAPIRCSRRSTATAKGHSQLRSLRHLGTKRLAILCPADLRVLVAPGPSLLRMRERLWALFPGDQKAQH